MIFSAPGRVNLIGEHTDYNEGFVLPGAIDKTIYVAISKNENNRLNVYANQFHQQKEAALDSLTPVRLVYLAGMMFHFQEQGLNVGGVDVLIDGNIPLVRA